VTDSEPVVHPATVVLVHGAWHGAWCWSLLQAELDRRGVPSLAVDLPSHGASIDDATGLHGHAAHVRALLDRLAARDTGPIVLVGHSYGGAVITQAASSRSDIGHLLYISAFALDDGESVMSALRSMPRHDVDLSAAMTPTSDGSATTLDHTAAPAALYADAPTEVIAAAVSRLCPQANSTMTEHVDGSPRTSVESTYVVCGRDRAVHPEHQSLMAARCTHRLDLDSDHSPFLSAVDDVADIVERTSRTLAAAEPAQ
jgi:pimeloyl-ACP methyl ester carboxylesterase